MDTLDSRFTDAIEGMYYTFEDDDNETKFIEMNNAFAKLIGLSKSELLIINPHTLYVPESSKKQLLKKQRLQLKGYLFSEEQLLGHNGVKLNVEVHSSKVHWGDKEIYFHVVKEISEKKWIASQVRNKPILASGILDENLNICTIHNHYEPLPFTLETGMPGASLYSYIDEADLMKVKRSVSKAIEYRQEKQVAFHTNGLYEVGPVKLRVIVKPLVNGNNDVIKVAFVLIRAEGFGALNESIVPPLLLACL
ncbi:PAS domain S-box protein [Paenibacillus sp. LMG 31456]|uniref:PAS domain S-box protein n=1 Tax=Paenibacillus foliorum TaxID=2654974 RepID=A0A972GRV8_9BACL|nr:PAS domain-containing protein [Paenibacillus foliorum]NOU93329.1 PAS domain S-box protein [Paenibacillus foliorum]